MNAFEKYHALGNDYLVYDPKGENHQFTEEETIRICHRNFGLGSDGILLGPLPSEKADYGLRILNPDGSEAEKSGNGLRIFARYLRDSGKAGTSPFTVDTLGGIVTCEVSEDASIISVEMGKVSFHSDIVHASRLVGFIQKPLGQSGARLPPGASMKTPAPGPSGRSSTTHPMVMSKPATIRPIE